MKREADLDAFPPEMREAVRAYRKEHKEKLSALEALAGPCDPAVLAEADRPAREEVQHLVRIRLVAQGQGARIIRRGDPR